MTLYKVYVIINIDKKKKGGNKVYFNLLELKAQRVRKGKTQEDVANVIGVKANTYARKESGYIKMPVEEFGKIGKFLEVEDYNIFFTQSVDK